MRTKVIEWVGRIPKDLGQSVVVSSGGSSLELA
jgi:hypothetical protein